MALNIQSLAEIVGGRLRMADLPPLGGLWEPLGEITADPRRIAPGDVFLALPETVRDDPCCVAQALDRGALGVIHAGNHVEPWAGRFAIRVDDVQGALWQLARAARNEYAGRVVAVAGTIGKSIACAMIDAVLGGEPTEFPIVNDGSRQRLPAQMLRLQNQAPHAVLELHGDAQGGLDAAAHLCCPHFAVVVDPLAMGLRQGDRARRTWDDRRWRDLFTALPDGGVAVAGPDAPTASATHISPKVKTFGRRGGCDVSASHILCRPGRLTFAVDGQVAQLNAWGRHWLDGALAAWCVGRAAGVGEREIAARLQQATLPRRRCEVTQQGGVTCIDDTACGAAASRTAPLELLAALEAAGRRIAVCGTGDDDEQTAYVWGRDVVQVGAADFLIAAGPRAAELIDGARDAGMPRGHCLRCEDSGALAEKISTFLASGDIVAHKGVDSDAADQVLGLFQNASPNASTTSSVAAVA